MNTGLLKKSWPWLAALLLATLLVLAWLFMLFYRMGQHDAQILAEFPPAYQQYDQALTAFSTAVLTANPPAAPSAPTADDLERQAEATLADLRAKASARISSLTRHDGELMRAMQQIADLSAKEFDTLKAYQLAPSNRDQLAKTLADLAHQRQQEYARFMQLAGK